MNQHNQMRKALRKVVELIQYQYTGSMKAMSALQDAANAAEEALAAEPAEEAHPQRYICPTNLHIDRQIPCPHCKPLPKKKPADESQPLAAGFVDHGGIVYWHNSSNTPPLDGTMLYTHPTTEAVRKLVGLTENEVMEVLNNNESFTDEGGRVIKVRAFANAIIDAMEKKAREGE